MSSIMPTKGTGGFIRKRIMAFLLECGVEMMKNSKGDQEHAMVSLLEDAVKARGEHGG